MTEILIMYSNAPPSEEHVRNLAAQPQIRKVHIALNETDAVRAAPNTEIFLGHRYLRQALPTADRLKWVQSTAAGVDALLVPDLFRLRPLLSRTPIFAPEVAWHALALAMSVSRRIAACSFTAGQKREPVRGIPSTVPVRVTIVGLGAVGRALGKLLQQLGIYVVGVERSRSSTALPCDELISADRLPEELAATDWLFLALPLNESSRGMVDAEFLRMLGPGTILINIARGQIVDHAALAEALDAGQLGGAGVDVADGVPGEVLEKLMSMPNFVYTPKIAGLFPERQQRLEVFVEEQVQRYLSGSRPLHCVDLAELSSEASP